MPVNLAVPKGPNPCVLITGAQAQAALGARITGETEAPLGPTCIFRVQGEREPVTVAIESVGVGTVAHDMKSAQRVVLSGHAAYCGTLGRPMLDVSLAGHRLLNVTAPCVAAERLAIQALPHISS
ncbi:MAG: hypothetical protein ACLP50_17230 [Solirubrobacteraceae bacterium]